MTMIIDHSRPRRRTALETAVSALALALDTLAASYGAWRDRRAVGALLALDDHMLTDMGVSRGDVLSAMASERGDKPSERLAALRTAKATARRAQIEEMRREARAAR